MSAEFTNATIVRWDGEMDRCSDDLVDIMSSLSPDRLYPRGLLVSGRKMCFPDDIANSVSEYFDFILITGPEGTYYRPVGLGAVSDIRQRNGNAIAIYESDLGEEKYGQVDRVNIRPDPNPYQTDTVFYVCYISIVIISESLCSWKLIYCIRIAYAHAQKAEKFTSALKVLALEGIGSIIGIVLSVDYTSALGIYSVRFFYPLMVCVTSISALSTYILAAAFQDALDEVSDVTFIGKYKYRVLQITLFFSLAVPVYATLYQTTRVVVIITVLDGINALNVAVFQLVFGISMYRARFLCASILKSTGSAVVTEERSRIERMVRFMWYSALAMFSYVFVTFLLGYFAVSLNGKATELCVGLAHICSYSTGLLQVYSFPKKPLDA